MIEDQKTYSNRFTEDKLKFLSKQSKDNAKKYWEIQKKKSHSQK